METLGNPASTTTGEPLIRKSGPTQAALSCFGGSRIAATRRDAFRSADRADHDVAIIGAGISGCRLFHELRRQGYRVLLIDRGDFASGTTQASGMMVWGGLLYLKDLDLITVRKLCSARDGLIDLLPDKVRASGLRYLPGKKSLRNRHVVHAGMLLYWLLGSLKRRFPRAEADFPEIGMLKSGKFRNSLSIEEAVLKDSDCRFALEWILPHIGPRSPALNHCEAEKMKFDRSGGMWTLELRDRLFGHEAVARARFIVNAAGVWTDTVNGTLGVDSPYRHELSKGVYVSIKRPEDLEQILIFDTGKDNDTLTISPWGPVALCGPTETRVERIEEGFKPDAEDVRSLLRLVNSNLKSKHHASDVISMRCGIRPLAVRRDFSKRVHPLELSRRHRVHHDRNRNVVAVYGGKLTSCGLMAEQVSALVSPHLISGEIPVQENFLDPPTVRFPGLDAPVPSVAWCRDREFCYTLEDYLRRRTNIAQWIPRGGLGEQSEHLETLRQIARQFTPDPCAADTALDSYCKSVLLGHDRILANA